MAGFLGLDELFKGRHFDREVIVLCVRWYLRFKLSYRDLVEMMAERNLSLAHTTIMRWVHDYAPEFERRWNRFARPAGSSWRVDETYVKISGKWVYLYRAVDSAGRTVDFRLSRKRDVGAAKAFFRKAIKSQGSTPRTITLDGYAGVVQNLPILGNTCARKSPAGEGLLSVSWQIVLFRRRRASPAQARWGCSGPSPSNVSQWG
jgi:transposase-like protein